MLVTALVLIGFLALTGWGLDRAYRASTLAGVEEQLRLVIYSLMGAAEVDAAGIGVAELPAPRLAQPNSGLYATIRDRRLGRQWRSPSTLASPVEMQPTEATLGAFRFSEEAGEAPLRTMAKEVQELEEGGRERLSDGYPAELTGLRRNLERFIAHERQRRKRYRKALEDLAHSLKTPLAVLRNAAASPAADPRAEQDGRQLVAEQLGQMEQAITHQLSKATVVGPVVVGKPIAVAGLVERLLRALETAYSDSALRVATELPAGLAVRGDEGDLMEIFGNLLENAFKYGRSRVRVSGRFGAQNLLRIEDDGPGIPAGIREEVLNRGARGDQVAPGQGIGLSVASELVALYGGSLAIGESALGGACVEVRLPL